MNATHEEWRPIVGHEDAYEVSSAGRVRSIARTVSRGDQEVRLSSRILKPWAQKGGYPTVSLRADGTTVKRAVHALVLEAFVGPRPIGADACHADGDPRNNSVVNLRWDTRGENMRDAVSHGTHNHARKTHCIHGHEFSAENTRFYTFPNGVVARFCRACKRDNNRKHNRRAT